MGASGSLCAVASVPARGDLFPFVQTLARRDDCVVKQSADPAPVDALRTAEPAPPVADAAQTTLDAIDFGVVVQSANGQVVAHNTAATRLLGLSPGQLIGLTSFDPRWRAIRSDGSDLPGSQHPAMVTLRTGEPVTEFEMGVRRPDGSLVWLLVSSRVRHDDPREVVATFMDISIERSAKRALLTARAAEQVILRAKDENGLLQEICDALHDVGGHRLAWIGLADDNEQRSVSTLAAAGVVDYLYDGLTSWSIDDGSGCGPVGTALREHCVVSIDDAETDCRFARWSARAAVFGFGSVVAIPFRTEGGWAVLTIYAADTGAFDDLDLTALASLGQNLEHALADLHRRRRLDEANHTTVAALVTLSEVRDPYTSGHQYRVAHLSAAIGAQLGLDAEMVWSLRLGGLVHDIGKTMVPAEILTRPGRLDPLEFALVQRHAAVGEEVLRTANLPSPIPEIAGQHHERLDGSGYPNGLRGEAICLAARIVAVADVVEAMAHHRPYRAGLGIDVAIAEIASNAGTLFDPQVVAATCRLFDDGYVWSTKAGSDTP